MVMALACQSVRAFPRQPAAITIAVAANTKRATGLAIRPASRANPQSFPAVS